MTLTRLRPSSRHFGDNYTKQVVPETISYQRERESKKEEKNGEGGQSEQKILNTKRLNGELIKIVPSKMYFFPSSG